MRLARDGAATARLTNDLNDYHGASFSRDGTAVVALQQTGTARMYLSEGTDPTRMRPITRGRGEGAAGVAFAGSGRLLLADQLGDGWTMAEDGSDLKPLPLEQRSTPNLRTCGSGGAVFERISSQGPRVFVADLAAGTTRRLSDMVAGQAAPVCTPDGQFVIYGGGSAVLRVAATTSGSCRSRAVRGGS